MKKKIIIFIVATLTVFALSIATLSLAKYYSELQESSEIVSDKFYFTVDLLGNTNDYGTLTKTYHLYGGDEKSISFNIQNYFDSLRVTEDALNYIVTVEDELDLASSSITSGTLSGNSLNKQICTINVEKGYTDNYNVKVTIASTKPYVKEMTINFVLHTFNSQMEVVINDAVDSLFAEVVVSSNIDIPAKSLVIDYSSINKTSNNLQADMTNSYLLDGTSIVTNKLPVDKTFLQQITITLSIGAGESVAFLFFKDDIKANYSTAVISMTNTIVDGNIIYKVTITESVGD